ADVIVAMPGQNILAVQLGAGGKFTAGQNDVLAPREFIGGIIFNDEKRRHRAVYQKLLQAPEPHGRIDDSSPFTDQMRKRLTYPAKPMLLAWAAPFDMQFTLPQDAQSVGSALLAIPLSFDRATPGTRMLIPSACLTYQSSGVSGAYDNTESRWI